MMHINPSISKSTNFGNLAFPTKKDYEKYFLDNNVVKNEAEIWNNEEYVSLIHRHWHGEGRNGCIFALLSARKAQEVGWENFVITKNIRTIENDNTKTLIHKKIEHAIRNPKCEILSLLFSNINSDADLVKLIKQLLKVESILLVDEQAIDKMVTLSLRVPLNKDGVLSWLMSFGPYDYFPQTRQSPITEIVIRVKKKPDRQFHRLNNDKEAAHLADLPLEYTDSIMEKIWENTLKRTRIILGGEPNIFSAAKTTFTLPQKVWDPLNNT